MRGPAAPSSSSGRDWGACRAADRAAAARGRRARREGQRRGACRGTARAGRGCPPPRRCGHRSVRAAPPPRVVAAGEGVQALDQRHDDLGQRGVPRLLAPLAQAIELQLGGWPVAGGGERHRHVGVVEEQERQVEPRARGRTQVLPAPRVRAAEEVEPPRERHGILKVGSGGDRDVAEHALEEALHSLVAPLGQVHEGEVPEQVVLEVSEMIAGMNARGQGLDAAGIVPALVVHVGHGMDGPGVLRIERHRPLRQGQPLVEAPVLLEAERVQPEHEGVLFERADHGSGQVQHVGRAPLPEVDEVQPLEQDHVARMLGQDRLDDVGRLVGAPADPEGERLDVAALALGQRGRRRRRGVHGRSALGNLLVEIQGHRQPRPREREVGIVSERLPEGLEGVRAKAEERAHAAIVAIDGGARGRGDGQPIAIGQRHGGHPIKGGDARRPAPGARPTSGGPTGPRESPRGRPRARTPPRARTSRRSPPPAAPPAARRDR